jgi:hypothetical protein
MCLGKLSEGVVALVLLASQGCSSDQTMSEGPVVLTYYRHDDIAVAAADKFAFDAYTKAHPNVTFDV